MIYDRTTRDPYTPPSTRLQPQQAPGYAVHVGAPADLPVYTLFTDDGRGNGDYICETTDRAWAFRIAESLDLRYYPDQRPEGDEGVPEAAGKPQAYDDGGDQNSRD